MNDELKTMWAQLAGWSSCLSDMCKRHLHDQPTPDPKDTRKPREHIERLLNDCGEIYKTILKVEKNEN